MRIAILGSVFLLALVAQACSGDEGSTFGPGAGEDASSGGLPPGAFDRDGDPGDAGASDAPDIDCDAEPDACDPPVKEPLCGDGVVDPGEACDDGNTDPNDGCAFDCKSIEANWACPTPGEACVSTMVCGDGKVTGTEECDDGNTDPNDGCSATCALEPGWVCPVPGVSCNAAACGDGIIAGAEECDDKNTTNNDGCSATCKLQTTVTVTNPTTTSPGGTTIVNWKCEVPGTPCVKTTCGNGTREGTEQCDDGNKKDNDGCSADCQWEARCPDGKCLSRCGDGVLFDFDGDGDGVIDEECDDGNTRDGDGCSSTCKKEPGYDCTAQVAADPAFLDVPIVLRDFKFHDKAGGHPDFESYGCNIITTNLTQTKLVNRVPVFRYDGTGLDPVTNLDPNGTCGGTGGVDRSKQLTSAADFAEWYQDTIGGVAVTRSKRIDGMQIRLTRQGDGSYVFDSDADQPYKTLGGFYPLDGKGWGNEGQDANNNVHNFAFTTELRFAFTYDASKSPELTFSGDDDVWVFINGRLALDVGGLHSRQERSFTLDPAKAALLELKDKHVYEIALFHAERHTNASNFKLTLRGFVKKTSVCKNVCGDGIKTREEQCDEGMANTNSGAYGSCRLDCKLGPYCGDKSVTSPPEECDDGTNLTPWTPAKTTSSCAPGCKAPAYCGDGIIQGAFGEQCDDGAANNTGEYGKCTPTCTLGPRCGDKIVQPGEECDDGNRKNGDGCSANCRKEDDGPK